MDITYNMIAEANKTLKPMDIKGKSYIEVNQRIKAFRMLYPTGYIVTEIIGLEDGVITMKATVGYYDEAGNPHALATGTAQEKESSSFINRSSFVENCETSCIGRAIGMVGITHRNWRRSLKATSPRSSSNSMRNSRKNRRSGYEIQGNDSND